MRIDRPEHYFRVSLERIKQAKVLYDEGTSYAFSMYAAGVAVECMLRAFKMLRDPTFDKTRPAQVVQGEWDARF